MKTIQQIFYMAIVMMLAIGLNTSFTAAEPKPAPANVVNLNTYNLPLTAKDISFRNPNDNFYAYFEIKPGTPIEGIPILDLWYSASPTIRPDLSTLSVFVNGIPVDSRRIEATGQARVNWKVALPPRQLRAGNNEIMISILHRSIDGLCRDIDNDANWFIIRPETAVQFTMGSKVYALADYPYPFINEYLAAKLNTVLLLADLDQVTLGSMFKLVTQWGAMGASGVPARMDVRMGTIPPAQDANQVWIGTIDRWETDTKAKYPEDAAILRTEPFGNGYQKLLVSGSNATGLSLASEALTRSSFMKTMLGTQSVFSTPFGEPTRRLLKARPGYYSLAELGYENDLTVAGAFHQEAAIFLRRPVNYVAGEGSYVELHFRHSPILDSKKSAVTVYINDVPVRAAVLMPENAAGGILKVPIPKEQLQRSSWSIRFSFYHDIGVVDCSKRFDDVAWSVVEKSTHVYLAPGDEEEKPTLADFPQRFNLQDGNIAPLTFWLPETPTEQELTLAAKIAYWIGRHHQEPIQWKVETSPTFDISQAPGTVIVLGSNSALSQRLSLKGVLPLLPKEDGTLQAEAWVTVSNDVLTGKNIYQVAKTGGERGKLVYSFSYSDPVSMGRFIDLILLEGNKLQGQITFSDMAGQMMFLAKPNQDVAWKIGFLDSLLSSSAGIYILILFVVFSSTIALMLYLRKRS